MYMAVLACRLAAEWATVLARTSALGSTSLLSNFAELSEPASHPARPPETPLASTYDSSTYIDEAAAKPGAISWQGYVYLQFAKLATSANGQKAQMLAVGTIASVTRYAKDRDRLRCC
jgi:hypothetical protein